MTLPTGRWWLGLMLALVISSCAADDPTAQPPTSTRPPLELPPNPGPPPPDDGLTDEVRGLAIESTVRVNGFACGQATEGSGFAIGADLIVTAAHVVVGTNGLDITTSSGLGFAAVPVLFDTVLDLAVLKVEGAEFVPLTLGTAVDGTIGALIGWEHIAGPDPTPFRIERPIIVRITEVAGTSKVDRPSWLLAAEVDVGDSGAALIDSDGVVVGITFAATRRDVGVGYAVRATQLAEIIETDLSVEVEVADCR